MRSIILVALAVAALAAAAPAHGRELLATVQMSRRWSCVNDYPDVGATAGWCARGNAIAAWVNGVLPTYFNSVCLNKGINTLLSPGSTHCTNTAGAFCSGLNNVESFKMAYWMAMMTFYNSQAFAEKAYSKVRGSFNTPNTQLDDYNVAKGVAYGNTLRALLGTPTQYPLTKEASIMRIGKYVKGKMVAGDLRRLVKSNNIFALWPTNVNCYLNNMN